MKSRWFKGLATVLGSISLSVVGIYAADSLQGIDRNMVGLSGGTGVCREGMVPLKADGGLLCVDIYEASPSEKCPHQDPANVLDSEENATSPSCYAASVPEKIPWRYVSLPQAQRMCAEAGKRLPKSAEWYDIALGTNAETCVITETGAQDTGVHECVSSIGAHDAIGNVWEWVDETVHGHTFDGRELPEEGYVASVDSSGVAITTDAQEQKLYGNDYFWSKSDGIFGMIRGGFYGGGEDAGLYTINASVPTSFATQGVGFRCVEDVL